MKTITIKIKKQIKTMAQAKKLLKKHNVEELLESFEFNASIKDNDHFSVTKGDVNVTLFTLGK